MIWKIFIAGLSLHALNILILFYPPYIFIVRYLKTCFHYVESDVATLGHGARWGNLVNSRMLFSCVVFSLRTTSNIFGMYGGIFAHRVKNNKKTNSCLLPLTDSKTAHEHSNSIIKKKVFGGKEKNYLMLIKCLQKCVVTVQYIGACMCAYTKLWTYTYILCNMSFQVYFTVFCFCVSVSLLSLALALSVSFSFFFPPSFLFSLSTHINICTYMLWSECLCPNI